MIHMNQAEDLGHGWYAIFHSDGLTVRNNDKGQRIELSHDSVRRLKTIFDLLDAKVKA